MKNRALAIFALVVLSLGCKDKNHTSGYGPTTVKGKVITYGTNDGIINANVWLYEVDNSGFSPKYSVLSQTTTNLGGEYTFTFNALKDRSYELEAKAYKHFENSQTQNKGVLEPGGDNQIDIPLYGFAIAKFRLQNITMANKFDFGNNMLDINGNLAYNLINGYKADTTILRILKGTMIHKIPIYIFHDDSLTVKTIDVEFKANDTTYVDIKY